MKWYALRCPQCNGEVEVEEDRYVFYCRFCGSKIVLDSKNIINSRIKIREIEAKENIKKMEYDAARDKEEQETKRHKIKMIGENGPTFFIVFIYFLIFIFLLGGLWFHSFLENRKENKEEKRVQEIYDEVQDLYFDEDYDRALRKAEMIYFDSSIDKERAEEWDKRRRSIINSIEEKMGKEHEMITMPNKASYYYHKKYKDAITELELLGFYNISTEEVEAFLWKSGLVTEISINGKTDFKENDEFPDDAVIVIRYTD